MAGALLDELVFQNRGLWRAAGAQPASLGVMAAFSIPASYLDLEGPGTIRPGRRLKWWYGTISPDLRLKSAGPPPHSNAEANKLWTAGDGDKLADSLPWNKLTDDMFGSEAPFVKQWLKEPWQDPWHLERDAEKSLVPNMNVCGWYDHCNGSIDLHLAIASRGANFHAKRHSRLVGNCSSARTIADRTPALADCWHRPHTASHGYRWPDRAG